MPIGNPNNTDNVGGKVEKFSLPILKEADANPGQWVYLEEFTNVTNNRCTTLKHAVARVHFDRIYEVMQRKGTVYLRKRVK